MRSKERPKKLAGVPKNDWGELNQRMTGYASGLQDSPVSSNSIIGYRTRLFAEHLAAVDGIDRETDGITAVVAPYTQTTVVQVAQKAPG